MAPKLFSIRRRPVAGLSEYLWELEQPAHAVANGYYVGAINRVGMEKPWSIGEFYGKSYFCNPRGKIIAQASRDKDEVLVADLDLDMIQEVRKVWQFFRDRRPETYGVLTKQSGKAGLTNQRDTGRREVARNSRLRVLRGKKAGKAGALPTRLCDDASKAGAFPTHANPVAAGSGDSGCFDRVDRYPRRNFREPRDYCKEQSEDAPALWRRKFFIYLPANTASVTESR